MKFVIYSAVLALVAVASADPDVYTPPDQSTMSSDARSWYNIGVTNANKKLSEFSKVSSGLEAGRNVNSELKTQLKSLLAQAVDADENTKTVVPRLQKLVECFADWSKDPSLFNRLKIKGTLGLVKNKRDNKSYYLLNGAALWVKLRVDQYLAQNPAAAQLLQELNDLKTAILAARDSFDDAAQVFVKALGELVKLADNLPESGEEFNEVADTLLADLKARGEGILQTSQTAREQIQAKINSL